MTVIAWDGAYLVVDRQGMKGSMTRPVSKSEIIWNDDGLPDGVVAVTGSFNLAQELLAWFKAGAEPEAYPQALRNDEEWTALIHVDTERVVREYVRTPYPIVWRDTQPIAFGAGREFAMGAMLAGCGALDAAHIACHLDAYCGCGLDVFHYQGDKITHKTCGPRPPAERGDS